MKQLLELTRKDLEALKAGDKVTFKDNTYTVGVSRGWIFFFQVVDTSYLYIRYGDSAYAAASPAEWFSIIKSGTIRLVIS
jgi:hypothetical protein